MRRRVSSRLASAVLNVLDRPERLRGIVMLPAALLIALARVLPWWITGQTARGEALAVPAMAAAMLPVLLVFALTYPRRKRAEAIHGITLALRVIAAVVLFVGVGTLDVGAAIGCAMIIAQAWWLDTVVSAGRLRLSGADRVSGSPHSA